MRLSLVTPPAAEPVTLSQAKEWIKQDDSADDDLITSLIPAARAAVENYLGRALVSQTWTLQLDGFVNHIEVPMAPLISVTSIQYIDEDGVTQTLSSSVYSVHTYAHEPGEISLAYNQSWPSVRDEHNAVTITFVAGYNSSPITAGVPAPIVHGIKLLIDDYYNHRGRMVVGTIAQELPKHIQLMLMPYVVMRP